MTTKIFKYTALLFLLLAGCSEKNDTDAYKFILGKWELIGHGGFYSQGEIVKNEPDGSYIEFLSDETARTYDSTLDEFYDYKTYQINGSLIIYNHEKTFEEGRFEYKYTITKNELKLTHYQGPTTELSAGQKLIYQRKQ